MSDDFSQKEIITRIWDETQKQSMALSTLVSEMKAVKEQTTKTNGRVTKLETRASDIERNQENLGVKVGAGVFLATTIVAIFINKYFQP